jgi:hypothetical protein
VTTSRHSSATVAGAVVDGVAERIQHRVRPWLQTREGVTSACVAVIVLWVLWAPVGAPFGTDLLGAGCAAILVSLSARLWESRTAPGPPPFALTTGQGGGDVKLERDENAGLWKDNRGFLWEGRVWFVGTGCPPHRLRPGTYQRLRAWCAQGDLPVFVARARRRQWWWWRDAFYWESGDYGPEDLLSLLLMLERDDEQGIGWELEMRPVEPISEEVKRIVFERDGGRCLGCGSDELIQFDHVVPLSLGGRNDPQNIRLVCAGCNRT